MAHITFSLPNGSLVHLEEDQPSSAAGPQPIGRIQNTILSLVSAFGFADNLKGEAVEWVEWIKNTNLLGFCTQGIVRVVTIILICIASLPAVDSHSTAHDGSLVGRVSSFSCACYLVVSSACS